MLEVRSQAVLGHFFMKKTCRESESDSLMKVMNFSKPSMYIFLTTGWGPYEYFRALEESRSNTNSGESVNELDVQPMSLAVVSPQVRKHGNEFAALEDLESGRR
jgi:hypothetical protein